MATLEGQLLAQWRALQELTQEQAAEACVGKDGRPMSRSHYRDVESGRHSATVATLLRMIRGLDVPGKTDQERMVAFFQGPVAAQAADVFEIAAAVASEIQRRRLAPSRPTTRKKDR